MLREVQELQNEAVEGILSVLETKDEVTFKAPTGSGKTHMMADLMNRVLSQDPGAVFLVSTLSKGGLAEQNFEKFKEYGKEFPKLSPYLVSSEDFAEEARPFIPSGYNVYVLGRDSYKLKNSRLTHVFPSFLKSELQDGKKLYLIKDECHQATNNLDQLSSCFSKKINFSATPKVSGKGKQVPDVTLTEEDAVKCSLIRAVEWGEEDETLEEAIEKFEKVKKDYQEELPDLCPCLIIQISNAGKAEEETKKIRGVLQEHPDLLWASLMTKQERGATEVFGETNSAVLKAKKKGLWAEELKKNDCPVSVIIFKMVITEGWDIPRACMLYQIRDTDSKVLDEQVLGRIRRNPKLLDFEELDEESQNLVTKAWAWGLKRSEERAKTKVRLADKQVQKVFRIKTTALPSAAHLPSDFDWDKLLSQSPDFEQPQSVFSLFSAYGRAPELAKEIGDKNIESVSDWYKFCHRLPSISKKTREAVDDPQNLTVKEEEVSFPEVSYYLEDPNAQETIRNWVWKREEKRSSTFSFDSQAEERWFSLLQELAEDGEVQELSDLVGQTRLHLLGKNFVPNSRITYDYTMEGEAVLKSYPDFVMKGKDGTVYVFEVKSVAKSANQNILDPEAYKKKVEAIKRWYRVASGKLERYVFCVPIWDEEWLVYAYKSGRPLSQEGKGYLTRREFIKFVRGRNMEEKAEP